MRILSINFGHDASLALMDSGRLLGFTELERSVRLKHCLGVVSSDIETFLDSCGVSVSQIDLVAVSSTQFWGAHHSDDLGVGFGYNSRHRRFIPDSQLWREDQFHPALSYPGIYASHLSGRSIKSSSRFFERSSFPFPFQYHLPSDEHSVDALVNQNVQLIDSTAANDNNYRTISDHFITPCILTIKGTVIPGFHVAHHFAHAAYSLYYAAPGDSLVISHDGGLPSVPFNSGGIYGGLGHRIISLLSHKLPLGYLYEELGVLAGFGIFEGPGKLMGLAPYGFPCEGVSGVVAQLLQFCRIQADCDKPDVDAFVNQIHSLSKSKQNIRAQAVEEFEFKFEDRDVSISIAANAQKLVEDVFTEALLPYLNSLIGKMSGLKSVGMTGGFALNCPVNTLMQKALGAIPVSPLPGAIDSGLSIGAAAAVLSYLGIDFRRPADADPLAAAFPCAETVTAKGAEIPDARFVAVSLSQPLEEFLAEQISIGKIIGLCRGCSEVGPRALGHRSLLAKASSTEIRDLINARKGRENWRPLAPMCRMEDFSTYFAGDPENCRFMLFTCPVISDLIPGVVHVDGTARVQTIDERDELLHKMLAALPKYGQPAVIINTSFNVAGEPIVETSQHAFNSFFKLGFDYLVIEKSVYRISPGTGSF